MTQIPDDLKLVTKNFFTEAELIKFIKCDEDNLIKYHFSLGMFYRNHYKLWNEKNIKKYSNDMWMNADDLSWEFMKIIHKHMVNLMQDEGVLLLYDFIDKFSKIH